MSSSANHGRAIEALDSRLSVETNIHRHRQLRIEKASILTKVGKLEHARQIISVLRTENVDYEPRLSAWIILTEGLVSHFGALDVLSARDKFRRSYAIAVAVADNELRAISAAWLADSDYRLTNYESALERVREAIQFSNECSYEALSRASLVAASIFNLAGDIDGSLQWYRRARSHAVSMGDIGTQSVMLFNSVSTRATSLIINDCCGLDVTSKAHGLIAELRSVRNLDIGLGITALGTMIPTLEAELLSILCNWDSAISKFNSVVQHAHEDGQLSRSARYYSELAWCLAKSGNGDKAVEAITHAIGYIDKCSDIDDTVIMYCRLSQTYKTLDLQLQHLKYQGYADHAYSAFLKLQESLRRLLADTFHGTDLRK